MIQDQKKMWNDGLADMADRIQEPSDFASSVIKLINKGDTLLELGCGVGLDASFFAQNGINTLATDFANQTIIQNRKKHNYKNLSFELLDMSKEYPYEDAAYNCVYACLSLHYFTHTQTTTIFKEIHRVLKTGGLLVFRCKSTNDPLYGEGDKLEDDMFIRNGHIRHFFSINYAKSLLKDFSVVKLVQTEGVYDGDVSNFVDCVARKI